MPDVLVLSNPIAGRGRSNRMAGEIATALRAVHYHVHREIHPDHPLPDAVVVVGGDGSLRFAAGKLLQAYQTVPPLVVIPGGTANLMANHLKLNWDRDDIEQQVITAIRKRKLRHLDAAVANGELFLLIAGVGFDAAVVAALAKVRSGPISVWSYVMPALKTIWEANFLPLQVSVDGHRVFGPKPGMVFVGNVKEYGTGFPVLPDARPDDGLLDICALPCDSHEQLLHIALRAAAGEHATLEGAKHLRGKKIRIDAKTPVPVQLDGDAAGTTPLTIELLPVRVPFIVR